MEKHLGINRQIHVLANCSTRKFNESFLDDDITGKQGGVLHFLLMRAGKQKIYQRDIEEHFGIRRSSVTSLLQKLKDNGYITRESVADDARLKLIVLTPKAMAFQKSVVQGTIDFEARMLQGVSEDEIATWQKVTQQMTRNLKDKKIGSDK
ncbi:MarR family winged helix-turn-helix transcriptional regulator [Pediococcus damnosus]|uniref:MarR family winged helix-turn-helix transcriptional regulator n=1 Tax=Pediococcus damnosus TaxID=51663 RepID=UPI000C1C8DA2|nr:MarR family transcriptional regulator [Pediococcus damnosus]PIO84839.1 hypothetical protein BSQ37_02360 [Pediococcus damnosus]